VRCYIFLYKIFDHYGVKNGWAIFAALAITFMSPQVYRMTGHYSMAYVFAIPALWWMIIRALQGRALLRSFFIMLYIVIFFFTHPYLGMILAFFCLFFWLVKLCWNRSEWKKYVLYITIQVLLPIIIFQGLVALTDTHENRLGQPAGFFDYYASWKSVFVAHTGPMNYFAGAWKVDVGNWESWNYVGFSTIVFAFFILIYLIRNRKTLPFKKIMQSELAVFTLAAYLILLFSFCFPLKYAWLRWIVELFGPLKQFRVLGRFAWIFFYVFTVFSIVGFYKISRKQTNKVPMLLVFCAGIIFYGIEFYPMHKSVSQTISTAVNPFEKENLDPEMKALISFTNKGNYDAIIFLPFQHMSSENLMLLGTEQANYDALVLSYHTKLPLMNSISSRMSLSEAILFNNFFSPEFVEKELVYDLPDSAKILIVKNRDGAKPHELRLLYTSNQVFENNTFAAFEFQRDQWNTTYYFDEVLKWESEAKTPVGSGWNTATDSVWFAYESFDDQPGESFGGTGALHGAKNGYDVIYELDTRKLKPGMYTLSFWFELMVDRPDVTAIIEQDSLEDRKAFWFDQVELFQSTFIEDNWCFVTLEFEVSPLIEKVTLVLSGNGRGKPFYLDELFIHKQGDRLFRRAKRGTQEYIIYNNYWLKADSFSR